LHLDNADVRGPAQVSVRLDGVGALVVATGTVSVQVEFVCTRCLVAWSEERSQPFRATFAREPTADEYPIEEGDWIDLEGPIRDEVALSFPLLPRCRGDCAGLCPTCGTDLNTGECPGHPVEEDSPFAALLGLQIPDQ